MAPEEVLGSKDLTAVRFSGKKFESLLSQFANISAPPGILDQCCLLRFWLIAARRCPHCCPAARSRYCWIVGGNRLSNIKFNGNEIISLEEPTVFGQTFDKQIKFSWFIFFFFKCKSDIEIVWPVFTETTPRPTQTLSRNILGKSWQTISLRFCSVLQSLRELWIQTQPQSGLPCYGNFFKLSKLTF